MLHFMRSRRNPFAQCLLALALLAVGMYAAIPQGYMLDFDDRTGSFSVVFCSAGMPGETRYYNMETGEIETEETAPDASTSTGICAFASAAAPVLTHADPLPAAPLLAVERLHVSETRQAVLLGLRPLPPARGPPASA